MSWLAGACGCTMCSPSVSRCWSASTSDGRLYWTVHVYLMVTPTDLNCVLILRQLTTNWTTRSDPTSTHLPITFNYVSCSTPCVHLIRRRGDMTSSPLLRRHVTRPWWRHAARSALSVTSWWMLAAVAAAAVLVVLAVVSMYCTALATNSLYFISSLLVL